MNGRMRSFGLLKSFVDVVLWLVEILLVLRLVLKLFGANPGVPFVVWVTDATNQLLFPFRGIFPVTQLAGPFAIEFSTLFALIVYVLLGGLIMWLIDIIETAAVRKQ